MSLIFPPRELIGKFDIASGGKVYPREGIKLTENEKKLLEQYQNELQESEKKHRYEIESV